MFIYYFDDCVTDIDYYDCHHFGNWWYGVLSRIWRHNRMRSNNYIYR